MTELPKRVQINQEGPREGFQFENGPIETRRKIELVDALSRTGLEQIQVCPFVPPKNVPGMADADEV
jgi:hydroxymethylglutaryl-CoA lyase